MQQTTPTADTYNSLEEAYNVFNRELFLDKLPACLLTLQRRSKRTYGFFAPGRFGNPDGKSSDELAMNPIHFSSREINEVLSTLAHEMTHVEQQYFGKPSRSGYHNKEWGRLMKRIGLYPSNSGKPGGKETGQQMTHYTVSGGPFETACATLLDSGFKLDWSEISPKLATVEEPSGEPGTLKIIDSSNRIKFGCVGCNAKAWGKPSLKLICGRCKLDMVMQKVSPCDP